MESVPWEKTTGVHDILHRRGGTDRQRARQIAQEAGRERIHLGGTEIETVHVLWGNLYAQRNYHNLRRDHAEQSTSEYDFQKLF